MNDSKENEQVAAVLRAGLKLGKADDLKRLPLMSVIRDEDGIDAVKLFRTSASGAHWADDTGTAYTPVMPVTILSVASQEAKDAASRGYLLDEEARRYWAAAASRERTVVDMTIRVPKF